MNITVRSILTGIEHTMDVPLTEEEFNEWLYAAKEKINTL